MLVMDSIDWRSAFKSRMVPWPWNTKFRRTPIPNFSLKWEGNVFYGWKGYFWVATVSSTLVKISLRGEVETVVSFPPGNWENTFTYGIISHKPGGIISLDNIVGDYSHLPVKLAEPEGVFLGPHTFWAKGWGLVYRHKSMKQKLHIPTVGWKVLAVTVSGGIPYFLMNDSSGKWFVATRSW